MQAQRAKHWRKARQQHNCCRSVQLRRRAACSKRRTRPAAAPKQHSMTKAGGIEKHLRTTNKAAAGNLERVAEPTGSIKTRTIRSGIKAKAVRRREVKDEEDDLRKDSAPLKKLLSPNEAAIDELIDGSFSAAVSAAAASTVAVSCPAGHSALLASEGSHCCRLAIGEKGSRQQWQQQQQVSVVSEHVVCPCLLEPLPQVSCIHESRPCMSELQPKGSCIHEGRPCLWAIVWLVMNLLRNLFKTAKSAASLPTPVFALIFKSEWPFPDALSRCERNPIDIFQCPFC